MFRKLLQTVPKYAFAGLILLIGLGSLGFWLLKKKLEATPAPVPVIAEKPRDNSAKIAKIENSFGSLILADNDLYDVASGELLFSRWLEKGMPIRLFWQADTKTVLAQYERGFIRYKPSGRVDAELANIPAAGLGSDYKWNVSSKGGDIYRTDIDWQAMKLMNERKVTSTGVFNDLNFAPSILLGTERTLLVRNANQFLRVDLQSGAHQPSRLPVEGLGKRKSPDQKSVVGLQRDDFYYYDVDADTTQTIKVGRGAMNDCQWLDNDRCVWIASGKSVVLYERRKNALSEIVALPEFCQRIGEASPDGRYVFAASAKTLFLVDLEKKTVERSATGEGVSWIANDTFAFARNVQDSEIRGTWLQTVGQPERRASPEPYLVANSRPQLMNLKSAGTVVFAMKHGLSKMKPDGTESAEIVKLAQPPRLVVRIEESPL